MLGEALASIAMRRRGKELRGPRWRSAMGWRDRASSDEESAEFCRIFGLTVGCCGRIRALSRSGPHPLRPR